MRRFSISLILFLFQAVLLLFKKVWLYSSSKITVVIKF